LGFRWVSIEFLGEFQRSSRAPAQATDAAYAAVEWVPGHPRCGTIAV